MAICSDKDTELNVTSYINPAVAGIYFLTPLAGGGGRDGRRETGEAAIESSQRYASEECLNFVLNILFFLKFRFGVKVRSKVKMGVSSDFSPDGDSSGPKRFLNVSK